LNITPGFAGHVSGGLYALTVLIWGTSWYALALQVGMVAPTLSIAYRFALATVLLMGFCLLTGRRMRFNRRDHLGMLLQGVFLFGLNYVGFYFATPHLTTGLMAVVFSTIVFMNILNGALLFRTPIQGRVVLGALFGLTGIGLVFAPELISVALDQGVLHGLLLSLLATYSASLGNMAAVHNQRRGIPVVQSNAYGMLYGTLLTSMWALLAGVELRFDWSPSYVGSLVYLAVFASVLAFGCYLTLLQRIGAARAAYATVLFPVVALGVSTALEGYQWTPLAVGGVALILGGNVLVLRHA